MHWRTWRVCPNHMLPFIDAMRLWIIKTLLSIFRVSVKAFNLIGICNNVNQGRYSKLFGNSGCAELTEQEGVLEAVSRRVTRRRSYGLTLTWVRRGRQYPCWS